MDPKKQTPQSPVIPPQLPDNLREALPLIGEVIADFAGNAPPVTIDEAARDCMRAAEVLFMLAMGAHEMRDRIEQITQRMTDIAVPAEEEPRKREVIAEWREQLVAIEEALGFMPAIAEDELDGVAPEPWNKDRAEND